jgi:hypothetical protein
MGSVLKIKNFEHFHLTYICEVRYKIVCARTRLGQKSVVPCSQGGWCDQRIVHGAELGRDGKLQKTEGLFLAFMGIKPTTKSH